METMLKIYGEEMDRYPTLSSQPPTRMNEPDGCQATHRIPSPGSGAGLNVDTWTPGNVRIESLYWDDFTVNFPDEIHGEKRAYF